MQAGENYGYYEQRGEGRPILFLHGWSLEKRRRFRVLAAEWLERVEADVRKRREGRREWGHQANGLSFAEK